jgi:hypothetical protein
MVSVYGYDLNTILGEFQLCFQHCKMKHFVIALLVVCAGFVNTSCGPKPPQTTPAVGGQCPGTAAFVDALAPFEYALPLGEEFCWAYVKTGSTCTLVLQNFQQCYQIQNVNAGKPLVTFSGSKNCGEIGKVSFYTSSAATPTAFPSLTDVPTTTYAPTATQEQTTAAETTTLTPTTYIPTTTEEQTTTVVPTTTATPTPTPSCCQPGGAGRSNSFHTVIPNNVFMIDGPVSAEACCTACVNDVSCIQWVMIPNTLTCLNYRNNDNDICSNPTISAFMESGSIRCGGEGCALVTAQK